MMVYFIITHEKFPLIFILKTIRGVFFVPIIKIFKMYRLYFKPRLYNEKEKD